MTKERDAIIAEASKTLDTILNLPTGDRLEILNKAHSLKSLVGNLYSGFNYLDSPYIIEQATSTETSRFTMLQIVAELEEAARKLFEAWKHLVEVVDEKYPLKGLDQPDERRIA